MKYKGGAILADIKTKEKDKIKIKKLDKSKLYLQKLKKNRFNLKEKVEKNEKKEENTPTEYASNQITNQSKIILYQGAKKFPSYGKKSIQKTKENIQKMGQKIKRRDDLNHIKNSKKTRKIIDDNFLNVRNKNMGILSESKKTINLKSHESTIRNISKISQRIKQDSTKIAQEKSQGMKKAYQIAKSNVKKTATIIKTGIKKSTSVIKAILAGTKAFILAIIAGRRGCNHDDCNHLFHSYNLQFSFGNFLLQ